MPSNFKLMVVARDSYALNNGLEHSPIITFLPTDLV